MKDYLNSRFAYLVDERIHNKRDREIMKLHYIDGVSADEISDILFKETGKPLTPRRISQILSDRLAEIAPFL